MPTTNLLNTYNTNTTYLTNDIVQFGNSIYQSIYLNQGVSPVDSNTWSLIFTNYDGIIFKGIWNSNIVYKLGQYVTYNNVAYISIVDDNTYTPTNATYWTQISPTSAASVISLAGDISYQGATTLTRLPIGNTNQVLTVNNLGYPAWSNTLPSGTANQILYFAANGSGQWTSSPTLTNINVSNTTSTVLNSVTLNNSGTLTTQVANATNINATTVVAQTSNATNINATTVVAQTSNATNINATVGNLTTVNSTTVNSTTINTTTFNTTGNVTIGGNLLVQGTTTTVNTDIFQNTEYANVIIANTTTSNVINSNTLTTQVISSNTLAANTINTKGIVVTSGYVGPYVDGIVLEHVVGTGGRISVGTNDGITFYAGGPGGTVLSSISTSGGFTTPSLTANTLNINNVSTIHSILETANVQSTSAGGTMNIMFNTGSVFYYTSSATSNMTFNFIYDGVTSLNNTMQNGQSISCAILVTQGATAYYPTTIQVDGTTVTPKWSGGTAPSSGDTNSIDIYTFNIIKTSNATYIILGTVTKFA